MNLSTICKRCKKELAVRAEASSRRQLVGEKGEAFTITCDKCTRKSKVNVNEVYAEPNFIYLYLAIGLSALVTIALWQYIGATGIITALLPIYIYQWQLQQVRAFNEKMFKLKEGDGEDEGNGSN